MKGSEEMTLEEAIKTAITYETKIRDVYKDSVQKAPDEVGKRLFGALAHEEEQHLAFLVNQLNQLKKTGEVEATRLVSALPSKERIAKGLQSVEKHLTINDQEFELVLLKRALKVEKETSAFYKQMVDELTGQGQAFFAPFVDIEEGHVAIVEAEIDAVSGNGFWFDMPEFNLANEPD